MLDHLRLVWWLLWHPQAAKAFMALAKLVTSSAYEAASFAVTKTAADPSWHPTKDHGPKRAEAIEWAGHWLREHGQTAGAWELGFCIEYAVGQRKGLL